METLIRRVAPAMLLFLLSVWALGAVAETVRAEEVEHVKCQICGLAIQHLVGFLGENARDEEVVVDAVEELCSVKAKVGEWLNRLDLEQTGERISVVSHEKAGNCRRECLTAQRACAKALRGQEDSLVHLLLNGAEPSKLEDVICKGACTAAPKPLQSQRRDEMFEPSLSLVELLAQQLGSSTGTEETLVDTSKQAASSIEHDASSPQPTTVADESSLFKVGATMNVSGGGSNTSSAGLASEAPAKTLLQKLVDNNEGNWTFWNVEDFHKLLNMQEHTPSSDTRAEQQLSSSVDRKREKRKRSVRNKNGVTPKAPPPNNESLHPNSANDQGVDVAFQLLFDALHPSISWVGSTVRELWLWSTVVTGVIFVMVYGAFRGLALRRSGTRNETRAMGAAEDLNTWDTSEELVALLSSQEERIRSFVNMLNWPSSQALQEASRARKLAKTLRDAAASRVRRGIQSSGGPQTLKFAPKRRLNIPVAPAPLCALVCASCAQSSPEFVCSGCAAVAYCCAPCQRAHWRLHRDSCSRNSQDKARAL